MVKLFCAIVGVAGSAFEVKIDDTESVSALKKAIWEEIKAKFIHDDKFRSVVASDQQLSLAKKGAGWLPSAELRAIRKGEDLPGFERVSLVDTEDELYSTYSIRDVLDTNGMPPPQTRQIHVLVEVPKDENDRSAAMALGVAPSLPPTTIHRHPERLKRWAAINEMIRQKNQEGNEKTSTRDTNKKRKNRDIDSSMPYSSLSWTDLEPILSMEDFNLEASAVPQKVVEELRDRLMQVSKLYGDLYSGKEAERQVFIMAIIEAVCLMLGDATILVEEDVKGKNVHVHGRFEFVLKRGKKRVSIVEANREDIPQGIAQNVAGLEALSDVEGLERTLGIVTNYLEWVFISDDDEKIRRMNTTLKVYGAVPSTKELREIVGMICGLLANST
ncbi:hypothetical protein Plhal304r1_c005g0020171 [Plasmopara halstedii]